LLELAGELVALAFQGGQVVVGEFAPLLLDLALDLFPIALHLVPVHGRSLQKPWLVLRESTESLPRRRPPAPPGLFRSQAGASRGAVLRAAGDVAGGAGLACNTTTGRRRRRAGGRKAKSYVFRPVGLPAGLPGAERGVKQEGAGLPWRCAA